MGETTRIAWTDHTWNPWWGCTRVSPACDHCYAEKLASRYGHDLWGRDQPRRLFGDKHWGEPLKWERKAAEAGERRRVFCASMADVFEEHDELDTQRARLWDVIQQTPHLDWLLLTKRPQNVLRMVPAEWLDREAVMEISSADPIAYISRWPRNAWVGTTVENQRYADLRIPQLLRVPAPVRFLSMEPLLKPVDLLHHLWTREGSIERVRPGLDWVIVGGESGPGWRPMDLEWARVLRDTCAEAGVPFFMKQPAGFRAGQFDQLPADLQVQQVPR